MLNLFTTFFYNKRPPVSRQISLIKCINKNRTTPRQHTCTALDIMDIIKKDLFFSSNYTIIKDIYTKPDKAVFIVKKNNKKYLLKAKKHCFSMVNEKNVYKKLHNNHNEFVLDFIDFYDCSQYFYFVYEYIDGTDLRDYANTHTLTDSDIQIIFKQILQGVKYIHNNNIIHCDLKLENIMITKQKQIKIIDFDLSKVSTNDGEYTADGIFGTMQYIAPESYDLQIYSRKTDVWSLGIILCVLKTKCLPFTSSHTLSCHNSYSNLYRRNEFKHLNMTEINKITNERIKSLILKMLEFKDYERYSVSDVLNYLTERLA